MPNTLAEYNIKDSSWSLLREAVSKGAWKGTSVEHLIMEGCRCWWQPQGDPFVSSEETTWELEPDAWLQERYTTHYVVDRGYSRAKNPAEDEAITRWLEEEEKTGNIVKTRRSELRKVCPIFAIPKRTGGFRVIHNLVELNKNIRDIPFRMKGAEVVTKIWDGHSWGQTLDLKDAFRHLLIHQDHQAWFGLEYRGCCYYQRALP